jgi:hypothetical protein
MIAHTLKNHIEKKPDWAILPYTLHDFSQHRSKEKLIFRNLQIDVFFFCCLKMEMRTQSVHRKSQDMALPIVTNRDNQGISELVNRLTTELFPGLRQPSCSSPRSGLLF